MIHLKWKANNKNQNEKQLFWNAKQTFDTEKWLKVKVDI